MEYIRQHYNECLLDGEKVHYHACTELTREQAEEYYRPDLFQYMGSGYITYHNGVKNVWDNLHNFYTRINFDTY